MGDPRARVVIIGAGLSGLSAAYRIQQVVPGAEITILEERSRIGGNIWTEHRDGFTIEHGPNGFLDSKPSTMQLCQELGLGNALIAGSEAARKNRYLYFHNQLHCLPGDPLAILSTPVLSWQGKLSMLMEPFRRRRINPHESIAEFGRRRFGREAADVFLDALVTGIYAGDPEQLGVAACFPRLCRMEAQSCSVLKGFLKASRIKRQKAKLMGEKPHPQRMWSFSGGLRVLIEALQEHTNARIHKGVRVGRMTCSDSTWKIHGDGQESWQADCVVDTSPAYAQAEHLADVDSKISSSLNSISYNAVAVVLLGYRKADVPMQPDGFGYIAPQNTQRDVLGVQWCSSIFPGSRSPEGFVLWRALCGGVHRKDMTDLPDETLISRVKQEMKITTGTLGEPVFVQVVRWPRAIPQYRTNHLETIQQIESRLETHPGLFLGGNAHGGVAMNDCTERASILANQVKSYLQSRMG